MSVIKSISLFALLVAPFGLSANGIPVYGMAMPEMACVEDFCVAAGEYVTEVSGGYPSAFAPMLIKTENGGADWQVITEFKNMPDNLTINFIDCSTEVCIVTGSSEDTQTPFLMISRDRGNTWEIKTDFDGLPEDADFAGVNCTETYCVIVGSVGLYGKSDSVILRSEDKGQNWEVIREIANLPSGTYEGHELFEVSCHGQFCAAIGMATNNVMFEYISLVVHSTDGGRSWTLVDEFADMQLMIHDFSCGEKMCAIVGEAFENGPWAPSIPVLFQSTDLQHRQWTKAPADHHQQSKQFFYVDCIGDRCIASGRDGLLAQTVNAGQSWTIESIAGLPQDTNVDVSCSDLYCMAAGTTWSSDRYPALASRNGISGQWEISSLFSPSFIGGLTQPLCTDQLCVAWGYEGNGSPGDLFLVQSIKGGAWEKVKF